MADVPFLVRWERQIRMHPRLSQLRQPGIGRSYPLFGWENDRLQVRFFYYQAELIGLHEMRIGAPQLCIIMDDQDGSLIADLEPGTWGIAPFAATTHSVPPEQKESVRASLSRLRTLYDEIHSRYPHQPGGEVGPAFWEALCHTVPPVLVPAYEKLSPDFMVWLGIVPHHP